MEKTKIEWCDSTWNPVTGCLHGCEYCYARRIAKRFGHGKGEKITHFLGEPIGYKVFGDNDRIDPYPFGFDPTLHCYKLDEPKKWTKPRTIFVCSMADLFGNWVPDKWIEKVFEACGKAPQHRYLFLTKNPQRYIQLAEEGKLPTKNNFWYGTTVTTQTTEFFYSDKHNTFVSAEPILEDFSCGARRLSKVYVSWLIVGAETGNRKDKIVPKREWIEAIVEACERTHIPVFMKDSLIPIVGEENMRREFPWNGDVSK